MLDADRALNSVRPCTAHLLGMQKCDNVQILEQVLE